MVDMPELDIDLQIELAKDYPTAMDAAMDRVAEWVRKGRWTNAVKKAPEYKTVPYSPPGSPNPWWPRWRRKSTGRLKDSGRGTARQGKGEWLFKFDWNPMREGASANYVRQVRNPYFYREGEQFDKRYTKPGKPDWASIIRPVAYQILADKVDEEMERVNEIDEVTAPVIE
jgi:hypothetical protein